MRTKRVSIILTLTEFEAVTFLEPRSHIYLGNDGHKKAALGRAKREVARKVRKALEERGVDLVGIYGGL